MQKARMGACLGGAHMVDPFPHLLRLLWSNKMAKETTVSQSLRVLHVTLFCARTGVCRSGGLRG